MFGCTGTIGEMFPEEKILAKISELVEKIKYTQNKYIWMKAALGIMTTDTQPKMAMEECYIGNSLIKIFGIAKGSGMIQPNMATTLGYIFTDISNEILKNFKKIFSLLSTLLLVIVIQALMIWLQYFLLVKQNIRKLKILTMKK